MPALKHERGTHVTVGGRSKRPPEERDGNSKARASGAGRPRKDGSPAVAKTPEQKLLQNRAGALPPAVLNGPPGEAEIAAFEERWGERPDDRLHPLEVWQQVTRPMLPFDMELAKEICDRLAEGQTIVWMVRNWPGFPGTRNWRSWLTQTEVREYRDVCLEARSEATILAGQDAVARANRNVETVEPALANAFVNAAKNVADYGIKGAQALAPRRFGQQLNVNAQSTATVNHRLIVSPDRLPLLERLIGRSRDQLKLIEGTAEVVDVS